MRTQHRPSPESPASGAASSARPVSGSRSPTSPDEHEAFMAHTREVRSRRASLLGLPPDADEFTVTRALVHADPETRKAFMAIE